MEHHGVTQSQRALRVVLRSVCWPASCCSHTLQKLLRSDKQRPTPRDGTKCAHVAVGGMDSQWGVRPVCVYFLWLPTGQAEGRAVFPMYPPHTPIVSVHGSDRYMVYLVFPQLIRRRQSAVKTAKTTASVCHNAGWKSTQRSYHTNYTLWAVLGAIGTIGRPPGGRCEHVATFPQLTYEKGTPW